MGLTIYDLNRCFNEARELDFKYIAVKIDDGDEKSEVIINHKNSFDKKQRYYNQAYDKSLDHRHAEGLRITGFICSNSFEELESLI